MAKIIHKKSSVVGKVPLPGDLDYGELALNYADGVLYYKTASNTVGSITAGAGGASSSWLTKTSNYTATSGDKILANTSSGSFTITLPSSPTTGSVVTIADGGNWATNNLTVARNGSTIETLNENFVLDLGGIVVDFVYDGSTWQVLSTAGLREQTGLYLTKQSFTATNNQTTFSINYTVGYVDVFLNGVRLLETTDFTATTGNTVVLTTGAATGDSVVIIAGLAQIPAANTSVSVSRQIYTATASQTTFSINYTPGYVDVYLNGAKLVLGTDFTATNGTSITLTTGATAGDILDIVAGSIATTGASSAGNAYGWFLA